MNSVRSNNQSLKYQIWYARFTTVPFDPIYEAKIRKEIVKVLYETAVN